MIYHALFAAGLIAVAIPTAMSERERACAATFDVRGAGPRRRQPPPASVGLRLTLGTPVAGSARGPGSRRSLRALESRRLSRRVPQRLRERGRTAHPLASAVTGGRCHDRRLPLSSCRRRQPAPAPATGPATPFRPHLPARAPPPSPSASRCCRKPFGVGYLSTSFVKTLGKTLCLCLVALAMDLVWGYTGILSLGHMAFFGIGGYAIGMWLMYARTEQIVLGSLAAGGIAADRRGGARRGRRTDLRRRRRLGIPDHLGLRPFPADPPSLRRAGAGASGPRLRLARLPLAGDRRLSLDPDPGDDAGDLALRLPERQRPLRGNNGLSGLQNIPGLEDVPAIACLGLPPLGLGAGARCGLPARGLDRVGQVRLGPEGHPRRRGAGAVSRLPRRGLQALRLHRHGDDCGRRGRALLHAGRHHHAERDRPHRVDLPRRLGRSRRARKALRRGSSGRPSCRSCRPGSPRARCRTSTSVSCASSGSTGGRSSSASPSCSSRSSPRRASAGSSTSSPSAASPTATAPISAPIRAPCARRRRRRNEPASRSLRRVGLLRGFQGVSTTLSFSHLRARVWPVGRVIGPNGAGKTTFNGHRHPAKTRPDRGPALALGRKSQSLLEDEARRPFRAARGWAAQVRQRPTVLEGPSSRARTPPTSCSR